MRILLEVEDIDSGILNQQKESADKIAQRKGHEEIVELIRNPPPKPVKDAKAAEVPDGLDEQSHLDGRTRKKSKVKYKETLVFGLVKNDFFFML